MPSLFGEGERIGTSVVSLTCAIRGRATLGCQRFSELARSAVRVSSDLLRRVTAAPEKFNLILPYRKSAHDDAIPSRGTSADAADAIRRSYGPACRDRRAGRFNHRSGSGTAGPLGLLSRLRFC